MLLGSSCAALGEMPSRQGVDCAGTATQDRKAKDDRLQIHGKVCVYIQLLIPPRQYPKSGALFIRLSICMAHSMAPFDTNPTPWQCFQGKFLGRGDIEHTPESLRPTPIEGVQFRSLAAGRNAVAGVAVNGSLLTWGSSALGRPGSGETPGVVQGLEGHKMAKVCMGEYHGVAIDDAGRAFVWGSMVEHFGQLDSLPGAQPGHTAAPLKDMPDCTVVTAVACGHEHTALITLEDQQSCSTVAATSGTEDGSAVHEPSTTPVKDTAPDTDTSMPEDTSSSSTVTAVAVAAAGLLRGGSSTAAESVPNTQQPDSVPNVQPASSVRAPGPALAAPFQVEQCENGAPRPAWISSCDSIPVNISALDRAWYGRYEAPTLDMVRASPVPACHSQIKRYAVQSVACGVQVMKTSQDIFEEVWYPWLPASRNPCYLSRYDEVKCLPFMSIIGVSKCGTTDLYNRLMDIPYALQACGGATHR